jgi:prophage maintenance system killer protein
MSEPSFLTVAQVERLHEKLIHRFGGSHGLRDRVLFESAVMQPYCEASY